MTMRILIMAILLAAAPRALAESSWLTVDAAAFHLLRPALPAMRLHAPAATPAASSAPVVLVEVPSKDVGRVARLLHGKLGHCGGFMFHADQASAQRSLAQGVATPLPGLVQPVYAIANQARVTALLARMEAKQIARTIAGLSAFPDRFYNTTHGARASEWLRQAWATIGARHGGVLVETFAHAGYPQASVIATIAGTDLADEVVVIGAHLDSVNTQAMDEQGAAHAPGADDDASGVAGLTEVLRAMSESKYRPRRTIKLIAYAAEEVGLRGSQDLARAFRQASIQVAGVLQLDMINYKGSDNDIYLLRDYTSAEQNDFLKKLIATYLPGVRVGSDVCGYACSDHASWHAEGYPASMPFESSLAQANPHIHSKNDTFANSGGQAVHALKFARLAAAFAIELGSSVP
ncbi:M20/M25/M40 family metallo-hydrolase [Massilia pseudoviolaceinigra]|uniref:M20/M25/M40 family metallo-hydrolase n=1 Tax=Massilia pseudoviolaceinigra TaxID=3057165 RepID=UPI0027965370|nr:M20/M25/M40 family metallo-hydrolase [Massilia sp. CCM 9206]MDQ1922783.1 M20/M25/M40 family metallo-hydrolase [Massilia sp. CCM 9206]